MSYHNALIEEFRKLVLDAVEERTKILKYGFSLATIEAYKYETGLIMGLEKSLELLSEAKENVDKRT